ncbi:MULTISPECIES: MFS transporter [unclassified Curtobacterium]|uniref:MFS transporter n=1 Tax=unclassified Curtobacterium TaxID=257496 RepID=UPI000B2E0521|nr:MULTISPECIES: MFS transporter [unclassified Curtobacterium]MCM3522522.1 MFS transporter [Curtobacterium sp. P97]
MSDSPVTAPPPSAPENPRKWFALVAITLASLMVVLDASIINIVLPEAQQELGISDADRVWAVTAYAITFGGLLMLGGRIADIVGRKKTLVISLIGFAIVSAIGGLSSTPEMLFAARAAQGVFAAALAPAALSLLNVTFTNPRERARAFAAYGAVQGAGGAVGLLLGGVLTEFVNWRWTLFINVPISLVAVITAMWAVRESHAGSSRRLDVLGAVLVTAGSALLVVGFTYAAEPGAGWTSAVTIASLIGAVVLLAAFVFVQAKVKNPMLPLRILTNRTRASALSAGFLANAAVFGMFLFLTYYLQLSLGFTPLQTGFAFLPFSIGIVASATLSSSLLPRIGAKPLIVGGLILATAGMAWLTTIGPSSWITVVLPSQILMGLGLGVTYVAINNAALNGVTDADSGVASATINTTQQLGGALGVALLNTVYATALLTEGSGTPTGATTLAAYQTAFLVSAALFLAATIAGLLTRNSGKRAQSEDPTSEEAHASTPAATH